jgi:hypothetical protein
MKPFGASKTEKPGSRPGLSLEAGKEASNYGASHSVGTFAGVVYQ